MGCALVSLVWRCRFIWALALFLPCITLLAVTSTNLDSASPNARTPLSGPVPAFFTPALAGPGYVLHASGFWGDFQPGAITLGNEGGAVCWNFPGAAPAPRIQALAPLAQPIRAVTSPKEPAVAVPAFSGIRYRSLYPGVDLLYEISASRLKSEFIVSAAPTPRSSESSTQRPAASRWTRTALWWSAAPRANCAKRASASIRKLEGSAPRCWGNSARAMIASCHLRSAPMTIHVR